MFPLLRDLVVRKDKLNRARGACQSGIWKKAGGSGTGLLASVSFNGTSCPGTWCWINYAYNVSSVQRTEQGKYVINFTQALPTAYYAVSMSTSSNLSTAGSLYMGTIDGTNSVGPSLKTTTQLKVRSGQTNGAANADQIEMTVAVFGG